MRKNNFKFKHSLGQNFIIDEFLLEDIADESGIKDKDFVLEIGAGNGALTRCLCDRAKYVLTVEIDKEVIGLLTDNLKEYKNVTIINEDFMRYDFEKIVAAFEREGFDKKNDKIKVVANLPYYITSPIIMKILTTEYISEMTIMVQKEVAERIVSKPCNKDYGVLTIACNYYADTEMIMFVGKECFYPVPKVDSAVVYFKKHTKYSYISENESKKFFRIVKSSFSQRRKKLINSLVNVEGYDKETIKKAYLEIGLDENVRAENLTIEDYIKLANYLP